MARDGQRVLPDEQVLERLEAVHRVARPDPDDALVGLDPDDRRGERASAARGPRPRGTAGRAGGRGGSAAIRVICIARSIAHRCGSDSLTLGRAASTVPRPLVAPREEAWPGRSSSRERRRRCSSPVLCLLEDTARWTFSSWTRCADRRRRSSSTSSRPSSPGRLSRREFIQRGTIVGLSLGSISAVIAACGGTDRAARRRPAPAPPAVAGGGTIRVAAQRPVEVDPVAMQDLGGYGITAQSFEFLCTADQQATRRHRARASPRSGRPTTTRPSGRSSSARASSGMTARTSRAADVVATMERLVAAGNSGLKGVLDPGGAVATDAEHGDLQPGRRQRQLPVPRLGVQRPVADHAGRLRRRHDARQGPGRDRRLEARQTYNQRDGRHVRAQPGLVGRHDAARRHSSSSSSTRPARWSPPTRAARSTPSSSSTSCPARPSSTTRTSTSIATPAALHRQIWMRTDTGAFADKQRPPGARPDVRPPGAHPDSCSRARPSSATTTSSGRATPTSTPRSRSGPRTSTRPRRSWPRPDASGLTATLHAGQLLEIPDLATLLKSQAAAGRDHPQRRRSRASTPSTAPSGAPPSRTTRRAPARPSSASSTTAIAATPDVYLNAALKSKGIWNSSQYGRPAFDAAFTEFQTAVGVDAQKAACTKIETDPQRRRPGRPPVLLQLPGRQLEQVHGRLLERARADVLLGRLRRSDLDHEGPVIAPSALLRAPSSPGVR